MPKQVCVIEIGSSKVICLTVAGRGQELNITGIGTCAYSQGYDYEARRRCVTRYPDEKELYNAIRRAVAQAEYELGEKITEAYAAVNSPFLKTFVSRGVRAAGGRSSVVEDSDENRLSEISLESTDEKGYVYIHSTPITYYLDGVECSELPVGRRIEDNLAAEVSHVFLDGNMANLIDACFDRLGIHRTDFVAVSLAEASYLIPGNHSSELSVIVDAGYMHIDISFIKSEALIDQEIIPVGGAVFASDLEMLLKIPASNAEMIKKKFNFNTNYTGAKETVRMGDGSVGYVDMALVSRAIHARTDELCDHILDYLEDHEIDMENARVYFTGGGFMMENCLQYIASSTGLNIVQYFPQVSRQALNTPNNISAFAVADFVQRMKESDEGFSDEEEDAPESIFSRIGRIFKK